MSLLIPGAGMPDICNLCPCCQRLPGCTRYNGAVCGADGEPITDLGGRRGDCPLIEIQQHGRLIDADALKTDCDLVHSMMMFGGQKVYTQTAIDNAPTIIGANYPPSIPLEQVWTEVFGEDGE